MTTITAERVEQRRALEMPVRSRDDGRGFTGIGVPYGQTIELWGMRERFEPGSIELDTDGVPSLILWQHDQSEPIGRITEGRDTEDGFEIEARLSDTARGREAATLLDDGVISRLSIGFIPNEYRVETDDDGTETVVHTKVRAMEFSLVSFPAYSAAAVTGVRMKTTTEQERPMDTLTRSDLDAALAPLGEELDDLKRSMGAIDRAATPAEPMFRSVGEYVKKVAAGDERALDFHARATTEDTGLKNETSLASFIKFVQDRRRLINLFDTGALPAKGMTVSYAQLIEDTTKAGEQAAQLDDLAGPGAVKFGDTSEPVRTFGGWTRLSRQVIERVEAEYLNTVMTALGLKYAKTTNDALRAEIVKVIGAQTAAGETLDAAPATVWDWRDVVIDARSHFDSTGFSLDGLLVSVADFKALQRLTYDNVPALTIRERDEFSGTLNLQAGDGDIARVPVHCVFGKYTGAPSFFDRTAVKSLESPGAPLRLQDDNIINLSREFSLYGYMSFIKPFPQGILPVGAGEAGA